MGGEHTPEWVAGSRVAGFRVIGFKARSASWPPYWAPSGSPGENDYGGARVTADPTRADAGIAVVAQLADLDHRPPLGPPTRGAQRAADEGVGRVMAVALDEARGQRREGDETPVVGGDRGERAFGVSLLSFGTDAKERRLAPLSVVQEDVDGLVSVALTRSGAGDSKATKRPLSVIEGMPL